MVQETKTGSPASHRSTLLSPAKINIFLRVLSRRPDGFHEIYSLIQPVSLYDEITIEVVPGSGIELSCTGPDVPDGEGNIAYKAASMILERTGARVAVSIDIKKRIPVGAGLGGGSSNAATVLRGLSGMLGAGLSDAELIDMAAGLGSDVPFFILGRPAIATGTGTRLTAVEMPSYDYILVNPGLHVSTAWVYGNLDLTKSPEDNILTVSAETLKHSDMVKDFMVNDLEPVTIGRYPAIASLKRILIENGAIGSLMSGSGSTVFGLFTDRSKALITFDSLKKVLDQSCSVFLVHGLQSTRARH